MPSRDEASDDRRLPVDPSPTGAEAFTTLFHDHYAACLRIARHLVRDDGLAHDVVQDVFLAWWRTGGSGYRPDRGELAPWLSTLTHHKAVDVLRTADRQHRLLTAAGATRRSEPEERLVDDVVWWELGRQSLLAALPTLPPKQREVLGLAYVDGLTQAEIATRLGIPLGTVKSRTHAGMLRLRAALSSTWTPTGPVEELPPDGHAASGGSHLRSLASARSVTAAQRSMFEDVEHCARDLLQLAAEERRTGTGSASMTRRAAALIDEHGDAAALELILTLARAAAVLTAAASPPACDGAATAPELE